MEANRKNPTVGYLNFLRELFIRMTDEPCFDSSLMNYPFHLTEYCTSRV